MKNKSRLTPLGRFEYFGIEVEGDFYRIFIRIPHLDYNIIVLYTILLCIILTLTIINYNRQLSIQMNHNLSINQSLNNKYDTIFNFYLAKDINDIIKFRPHFKPLILMSEYLRVDCDTQMLKRFYSKKDFDRITLLAEYYSKQRLLPNQSPLLFLTSGHKPISKRIKRRYKKIMKQKQEEDQKQLFSNSETFLKSIKTDDLDQQSQQIPGCLEASMQTITHDIYASEQTDVVNRIHSHQQSVLVPQLTIFNKNNKEMGESGIPGHLIIDFQDKDVDRILRQYNSLNNSKKHNRSNKSTYQRQLKQKKSFLSFHNIEKQKIGNSSAEERSCTMSKSKKTLPSTSRNPTIKNVKVSQQYYQGSNPNVIQYKKMISINSGQSHKKSQNKNTICSKSKVSSVAHEKPRVVPTPKIQKIIQKQRSTGRKVERIRTQMYVKSHNSIKNFQYESIRQKADRAQEAAMRALSKYRMKAVKNGDALGSPRVIKS